MKRAAVISCLLIVLGVHGYGQLGAVDGQLRYEHRYQDFEHSGNLTRILVQNPVIDLRMRGNILSRRLMSYSVFSSLSANYVNTNNDYFSFSASQYSWNRYNIILNVLPYSPVKLTLAARENAYEITSKTELETDRTSDRLQEQRAEISVHQVPWLPTLSLSYLRNRSYSALGLAYEVVNQTLTFTASGATDTTGSYGLSASLVDLRDKRSSAYDRFLTMQFSATRALSEKHGVNVSADYEKYSGYSVLSGSAQYSAIATNKLRLTTSVSGSSGMASYSQSWSTSVSQSASYRINSNFQAGAGVTGFLATTKIAAPTIDRNERYRRWSTSWNVQHRRSFGVLTVLNGISAGYSEQRYAGRFHNFNAAFSNRFTRPLGVFSLNGDYLLSYLRMRNSVAYDVVDNTAALILGGILPYRVRTQTDLRYRDSRYPGDERPFRNQRALFFTQRFDGSFVAAIPFTVGVSGSANWYLAGLSGHTYGWSASFVSPSFFLKNLSVSYAYSRSFDPYYRQEVPEHNGSMAYHWRALTFVGRFRYASFPIRVREVQLSVARPF